MNSFIFNYIEYVERKEKDICFLVHYHCAVPVIALLAAASRKGKQGGAGGRRKEPGSYNRGKARELSRQLEVCALGDNIELYYWLLIYLFSHSLEYTMFIWSMWGHVNKKGASAYLLLTPLFICPSFHQLHKRARSSERGGNSQKHILGEILSCFPVSCKFGVVNHRLQIDKSKNR